MGSDPLLGDGAGILIQIPDPLIRGWADANGHDLPAHGDYGVAMCFLPQDDAARDFVKARMEAFTAKEGQRFIGWREVPTTMDGLGAAVIASMPVIQMAVIARGAICADQDAFERKLLTIRKQVQNPLAMLAEKHGLPGVTETYIPSFSTRTIVYKGLLLATQVGSFMTTCAIRPACRRSGSSTSAFPPTPSPAGGSRTLSASSPTTARSTRCAATSTG